MSVKYKGAYVLKSNMSLNIYIIRHSKEIWVVEEFDIESFPLVKK